MNKKKFEEAAAACRNAQIFVEECRKVIEQHEESAEIRAKTCGMISAAVDSLTLARANLAFCADTLYRAIDENA